MRLALFVVTDGAVVVLANRTAERLVEEDKRVLARDPEVNAAQRAGIVETARTARHAGLTAKRLVAVPRGAGRDPCLAEISPLHDTDGKFDGAYRGALVSVIDPELRSTIDLSGLDAVYALNEAESAGAVLVVDGLANAEIADARGVTRETVKSQIRALSRKTGSRNLIELVRRVLMLNLPPERDDANG